jgi:hypothetical protein
MVYVRIFSYFRLFLHSCDGDISDHCLVGVDTLEEEIGGEIHAV